MPRLEPDAREIEHAEAQQQRQHDQRGHDVAREDHVDHLHTADNTRARDGEGDRSAERHGDA
jgi:hypothetical protein